MMTAPGYGQPMMHAMMPQQTNMQPQQPQQPPQQQQPPPQQQQPVQQQHPAQQQDDLAVKVRRSFAAFENHLKVKERFKSKSVH